MERQVEIIVDRCSRSLRKNVGRDRIGHSEQEQRLVDHVGSEVGDKPGSGVRWIRSYVVPEEDGKVGTVCIYQADSPETIRAHAAASAMPANEIERVLDTVIVRPDPVAANA